MVVGAKISCQPTWTQRNIGSSAPGASVSIPISPSRLPTPPPTPAQSSPPRSRGCARSTPWSCDGLGELWVLLFGSSTSPANPAPAPQDPLLCPDGVVRPPGSPQERPKLSPIGTGRIAPHSPLTGRSRGQDQGEHLALEPHPRAPPGRLAKDQLLFIAHEWIDIYRACL